MKNLEPFLLDSSDEKNNNNIHPNVNISLSFILILIYDANQKTARSLKAKVLDYRQIHLSRN